MSWVCLTCGARFDAPDIGSVKENLDGEHGIEIRCEVYCPYCGDCDIEEVAGDEQDEA